MTEEQYLHPDADFLQSIDIHTLLPQQEPFVMVGRLTHFDDRLTVTETLIESGNIFVEDDRFTPAGLMENIAQTCAARIGYVNKYILQRGIQVGVIGSVSGFSYERLPRSGERLRTEVTVEEEVFGMILARASVSIDGNVIASCRMKIAIKEETA